ncbi:MAG: selenocysteine-specific translation elongation factor [bacterium]|nr:selenocysteine-specific translation elongation factor [bacterium]
MIVVGTAGHIDHGKSAIVKRLTGHDPDRLPEEKARGMTIDLGFAFMKADSGEEIAFIDVPGHERFVKNMISGAGGIDLVMLVIAADDGWMPQSEEHFQIIRLLGVKRGLIVINKIDLVEEDWLALQEEEIRDKIADSFLADCPLFRVSAQTGSGFDELSAHLNSLTEESRAHRDIGKARLYVDRAFMRVGIGRVVAGTLRGGELKVGQQLSVWPGEEKAKIRSLQTNGQEVDSATPGQRTAVTISGVDKENLFRGAVLTDIADTAYFEQRPVLALSIELLKDAPVALKDRRRALLIVGTTEVLGELRLYRERRIEPGSTGILFFKPDEDVLCLIGDHYILRLPTPMVTLGGGMVLDHLKAFPRRKEAEQFEYLVPRCSGELTDLILSELNGRTIVTESQFLTYSDFSEREITKAKNQLIHAGVVGRLESNLYHVEALARIADNLVKTIESELQEKPHLKGLAAEEIARLCKIDEARAKVLLTFLESEGRLVKLVDRYNLVGRGMSLKGDVEVAHERIIRQLEEAPLSPPRLSDLAKEGKAYREAIRYIIESGQGYKCGSEFLFLTSAWENLVSFIKSKLNETGSLTVGDLRDKFEFSRKYAIPILEETDRIKLTARDGDSRIKGAFFEKT